MRVLCYKYDDAVYACVLIDKWILIFVIGERLYATMYYEETK